MPRDKGPATRGELLGKAAGMKESFSMDDLKDLLGEPLPSFPRNRVGRLRLLNALKRRLGPAFRNIKGIDSLLKEFDGDMSTAVLKQRLNNVRVNKDG